MLNGQSKIVSNDLSHSGSSSGPKSSTNGSKPGDGPGVPGQDSGRTVQDDGMVPYGSISEYSSYNTKSSRWFNTDDSSLTVSIPFSYLLSLISNLELVFFFFFFLLPEQWQQRC